MGHYYSGYESGYSQLRIWFFGFGGPGSGFRMISIQLSVGRGWREEVRVQRGWLLQDGSPCG